MDLATEEQLKDSARMIKVRAKMEQRRNAWYQCHLDVPRVEGNDDTRDYGVLTFRKWRAGEVMQLMADDTYQKANKLVIQSGQPTAPTLTLEDQQHLFSLYNQMIALVLHPDMKLTREDLDHLEDWTFTRFVFAIIASKSGMDTAFMKDLEAYFRDT